jgi:hypothetical protein
MGSNENLSTLQYLISKLAFKIHQFLRTKANLIIKKIHLYTKLLCLSLSDHAEVLKQHYAYF